MLKKSLFAAAVFVAALAGPPSALAEPVNVDAAHCQVNGTTVSIDPVQIIGGTGTFHLLGTATCAVHGDASDPAGVVLINIDSVGTYNNTICSTGTADGTAYITGASPELPATIGYHIQFMVGAGWLQIIDGSHADGSGATGGGAVDITPTNTGGCVTGPARGFILHGEVSLVFNDA